MGTTGQITTATLILLGLALHSPAKAASPLAALRGTYAAQFAQVSVFDVQPGREVEFQNALLQAGPYNKLLKGFANERVLELNQRSADGTTPSAPAVGVRVIAVTRCYDADTALFVQQQRTPALRGLLTADPVTNTVRLVEHVFGNWSWEKPATPFALVTTPNISVSVATSAQQETLLARSVELFSRSNVSLSFLKDGYVGQLGMLDSFPASTDLQNIRSQLQQRQGLMGASIYQANDSSYLVYSEYFRAPATELTSRLSLQANVLQGAQLGTVVQNYVSR